MAHVVRAQQPPVKFLDPFARQLHAGLDADTAVEGLRYDVEAAGNAGHRLAIEKAAGAIDGVDGDGGKPQLLRGFDNAGAAAALVFHLVVEFRDLGARALGGNVLFQVRGDAFIAGFDCRLDLADLDHGNAEPARHGLADLA